MIEIDETTYHELMFRLVQAEEMMEMIRNVQVDALVGNDDMVFLRVRQSEEARRKAQQEVERQVEQQRRAFTAAATALRSEIVERKKIEERLRYSRELFAAFMEHSPAMAFVKDEAGRYLYANKRVIQLLNRPLAEVLGKTDDDLLPAEFARQLCAHDAIALTTDKVFEVEETLERGGRVRHWLSFKFSLVDPEGQRVLAGMSIDVSERRYAENALVLMSKVFQEATVPILIKDSSGRIIDVNAEAERVYGWTCEELQGQPVSLLSPPERRAEVEELSERCWRGEEVRNVEREHWTKAGRRFPVLLTLSRITDAQEQPQAIVAIAKDISALKQAEAVAQQQRTLAMIGRTITKVRHEIGNPLNGMSTTLQLLEQHLTQQEDQADEVVLSSVQDLKNEMHRLQTLLYELRTFQPVSLQRHPLSLSVLAADTLRQEAGYYRQIGIQVEQDLSPELPPILGDADRLKQVFLNLYKNAVEAMPQGGVLTVRGYAIGEQVALEVADTGEGIPAEIDIFEPFVSTKSGGTGLGMAIVRQVVTDHQGMLTYTSDPGKGTTFLLVFPSLPVSGQQ